MSTLEDELSETTLILARCLVATIEAERGMGIKDPEEALWDRIRVIGEKAKNPLLTAHTVEMLEEIRDVVQGAWKNRLESAAKLVDMLLEDPSDKTREEAREFMKWYRSFMRQ